MGSVLPDAIDYLVAGLPTPLEAIDPAVYVADNEPGVDADSLVVIGRASPTDGTAASGTDRFEVLGAGALSEDWTLDGYVWCRRPGPGQADARRAAFNLFDGVISFLHQDLTLGGLLLRGRYAVPGRPQLTQTQDDQDTGTSGALRTALVSFQIIIPNLYLI